jgi:hypothetical protein
MFFSTELRKACLQLFTGQVSLPIPAAPMAVDVRPYGLAPDRNGVGGLSLANKFASGVVRITEWTTPTVDANGNVIISTGAAVNFGVNTDTDPVLVSHLYFSTPTGFFLGAQALNNTVIVAPNAPLIFSAGEIICGLT